MQTRLFVISDLHLGGAPASDGQPAFQMCTEQGRAALGRFVEWASKQRKPGVRVHLVIAGDIVDFLAEEREGGFAPFTSDDARACEKLKHILKDTEEVWGRLAAFVRDGGALTLMLGNHDLELSLPGPRRLLLDTLGPGRVEFLYDNQALSLGKAVLVEHGNRYDDWNAVPHDDLREVRSRLSRGETAQFDPLPGSRMVVDIVNPTKKQLSFVDLLKPEDAALLPFLALLSPSRFKQVSATLANRVRALRVRYGPGQQPKDRNYIGLATRVGEAAEAPEGTGDAADDALLELAQHAAAGGDANQASSDESSFLDRWKAKLAGQYRERQLDLLLRTLRAFRSSSDIAFDVATEKHQYLTAATETAARGFQVVVFGHTHIPKRIPLDDRRAADGTRVPKGALYLNSGTWADLMAIPRDILGKEGEAVSGQARERLRAFADDLAANDVTKWRCLLPTFVDISISDGRVLDADVRLLDESGEPTSVTTELIRKRLQREGT